MDARRKIYSALRVHEMVSGSSTNIFFKTFGLCCVHPEGTWGDQIMYKTCRTETCRQSCLNACCGWLKYKSQTSCFWARWFYRFVTGLYYPTWWRILEGQTTASFNAPGKTTYMRDELISSLSIWPIPALADITNQAKFSGSRGSCRHSWVLQVVKNPT